MYATPSCLRIVSGMFQSPDFVKARKRQVEVEQGKEREKEPWKRNKGGRGCTSLKSPVLLFVVLRFCLCFFQICTLKKNM